MRLVRFPRRPARISPDIRAALTSLGRGEHVIGGVGLVGVLPTDLDEPVDAVLVVPHGVVIVIGVDLPDPAVRLEAPLRGQWKADGWPLVRTGDSANPAQDALVLAEKVGTRIRSVEPAATIGTVVAVGPFVEKVEQPAADLTGPVRVVYPTATSLLAATVSLASAEEAFTVAQARAILAALDPVSGDIAADVLAGEGFAPAGGQPLRHPQDTVSPDQPTRPLTPAVPSPAPRPRPPLNAARVRVPPRVIATPPRRRRIRHWRLIAAGALVVLAVAGTIALTTRGSGTPAETRTTPVPTVRAGGFEFVQRASGSDGRCAHRAVGDLKVALTDGECVGLRRGSFETTVRGVPAAVSLAALTFSDEESARDFLELADTPGTGTITDLATETGRWPGHAPSWAHSAYAGALDGVTVRLALACPRSGNTGAPALADAAEAALDIPLAP
ncbi:hypothetical protein ACFS2C_11730 [Prauserella oleivorans]|uniref:Uncharacterized protein n=1 Tax=Prauserella oleivorans TaxID=1478153 RepID=A0ABW5WAE4_9PSEU